MAKLFTTAFCRECKQYSGTGCPVFGFSKAEINQQKTVNYKNKNVLDLDGKPQRGLASMQLTLQNGCPRYERRRTAR